jgi:hypothetical protein
MTRTTNTTARSNLHTPEGLIRFRAKQAAENFEEAKAKYTESFATNPKYAIEWYSDRVARAQTHYEFWMHTAEVLERRGVADAIEYAAERVEREVESFFGSKSTCPWHNATRRAEAETFNAQ